MQGGLLQGLGPSILRHSPQNICSGWILFRKTSLKRRGGHYGQTQKVIPDCLRLQAARILSWTLISHLIYKEMIPLNNCHSNK